MSGNLELMSSINAIFPCPVGLPDRKEAMAKREGTMVLNENLKLNNVLNMPNLKCNLIPVSQLCKETKMHCLDH